MRFLVTFTVHDTIVLDDDKRLRNEVVGPRIEGILGSDMVRESGIFTNNRGGFLLMDTDEIEELYALLGPEIYGNYEVVVQPIVSAEKIGELFQRWASEGR